MVKLRSLPCEKGQHVNAARGMSPALVLMANATARVRGVAPRVLTALCVRELIDMSARARAPRFVCANAVRRMPMLLMLARVRRVIGLAFVFQNGRRALLSSRGERAPTSCAQKRAARGRACSLGALGATARYCALLRRADDHGGPVARPMPVEIWLQIEPTTGRRAEGYANFVDLARTYICSSSHTLLLYGLRIGKPCYIHPNDGFEPQTR